MTRVSNRPTRERLLDAAGRTFADKRFRDATVREICDRAGANVAAVNYHFGDKRTLYKEVLVHALNYAREKYPPEPDRDGLSPEERLHIFVRSFLLRRMDPERPGWHRRLLHREMTEPSPGLRDLVHRSIQESRNILRGILFKLLGTRADHDRVELVLGSVIGQCLYWGGRRALSEKDAGRALTLKDVERLARHIAGFTLAALGRTGAARSLASTRGDSDG